MTRADLPYGIKKISIVILAKQRLGGLRPAITGDKKLHRNNKYNSNAENKVRK
jgi:hypothetical protein